MSAHIVADSVEHFFHVDLAVAGLELELLKESYTVKNFPDWTRPGTCKCSTGYSQSMLPIGIFSELTEANCYLRPGMLKIGLPLTRIE